ncbi:MAG: pseudouridine-5'-phosphate glycosidase, partial [Hyphomicrobiales bacterium]|nr:pseudouridine-5'-phosphate glycosidase [Hyphomicrobiales bacterium]
MTTIPDNSLLEFTAEIKQAMENSKPVVALESTIITHGMPWPQNIETARAVETNVREAGAIPATIAVMDAKIKIGLCEADLVKLAKAENVMKLSRADLAFAISQNRMGSTTVAATMMAAELAGIEVFATGGIGGVHKGGETSMDISADLNEFAKTPVIVVCAGAKAILD